jgi:FkbM family methyltransferase
MSLLQRILLVAYRVLSIDTFTRFETGERAFLAAFFAYKKWIEDPHAAFAARRPDVFRGGDILDVGANVGYTATVFANVVSPGHLVHAFEPDDQNFARMNRVIDRRGQRGRIVPVASAVGDHDGTARLRRNAVHPGDHQLVTEGEPGGVAVPVLRLDTYAAERGLGVIKFVKIDVQGHELAVSKGLESLIRKHPNLEVSFEYSGPASDDVVRWYSQRGFVMQVMRHDGRLEALTADVLRRAMARRGYVDLFATRVR